jgi:hypothetical protein
VGAILNEGIRVGMCGERFKSRPGVIALVKLRSTALAVYGRSRVIPGSGWWCGLFGQSFGPTPVQTWPIVSCIYSCNAIVIFFFCFLFFFCFVRYPSYG